MSRNKFKVVGIVLILAFLVVSTVFPVYASTLALGDAEPGEISLQIEPSWLEPRGLNIVDLVGFVPEKYLHGSILSFTPGYGIVQYEAGERLGSTVVITTSISPRYRVDGSWTASMFGCLGQPARIDQWGSISPPSTVRAFHDGQDVTQEINLYNYVPAGLNRPIRNPRQSQNQNEYRYYESPLITEPQFTVEGELKLPANMGCELLLSGKNYPELTAVFTVDAEPRVDVTVVDEEIKTFKSYLGSGYAGVIQPLVDQLKGAGYGDRHDKLALNIPAEGDYFLVNFPPMPVDPYTNFQVNENARRPVGGTYRMDTPGGLSVDHVNTMALPLLGHWKDMDLGGGTYLTYMEGANALGTPEYFVPAGVEYNPCMRQGNCSSQLLEKIYNTEMTLRVIYLKVERTLQYSCGLKRVPLRMVGPDWSVSSTQSILQGSSPEAYSCYDSVAQTSLTADYPNKVYLPLVLRGYCAYIPPDTSTGCPCGWLTEDGRMVDFIP